MNKETYQEMKKRQREEVNRLPIYWAFGDKQYQELLQKLNKTDEEIQEECFGIFGGLAFKKDKEFIIKTLIRHDKEMTETLKNDNEFLKNALIYELGNHEYIITYNTSDTFRALGLSKQFFDDEEKHNILIEAIEEYKKDMERLGW